MTQTSPDPRSNARSNSEQPDSLPGAARGRASDRAPAEAIFGPEALGGQRDIPDMRRDAIEEASETSEEARERFDRLDAREEAADPALRRQLNQAQ